MTLRRRVHPAFAVAAALLAFILTIAYAQQQGATKTDIDRREKLAALIARRQARTARFVKEIADLRKRIDALRTAAGATGLQRQIAGLGVLAGTTALEGEGVRIALADSPLARQEESPDFRIQDLDLQLVVNELWAAGAEAIAVNGQRIVSTSAIRSAGQSILVNYRVLTSPYQVDAIGPGETLKNRFEGSKAADRFRTWAQVYRLSIDIAVAGRVRVPAYTGSVRLRHATPAPRATERG